MEIFKNQQFEGREANNKEKRKIVLVGKTGNGKSSIGNTLLGKSTFNTAKSPLSVAQKCKLGEGKYSANNVLYSLTVVDTPGLMETDVPLAKRLLNVQESIVLCPQPHAFLLIFSSADRMTKDEEYTVDLLRVAFGEKVFDHCIIVFTHGNDFQTDQEFKHYWEQSQMLVDLVKRCGGRIVRIENESLLDLEGNEHVKQITEIIEKMSIGGKKTYDYDYIDKHQNVIKEHLETFKCPVDYHIELNALVNGNGEHLTTNVDSAVIGAYGIYAVRNAAFEMAKYPIVWQIVWKAVYAASSVIASAAGSLTSKFWKK